MAKTTFTHGPLSAQQQQDLQAALQIIGAPGYVTRKSNTVVVANRVDSATATIFRKWFNDHSIPVAQTEEE